MSDGGLLGAARPVFVGEYDADQGRVSAVGGAGDGAAPVSYTHLDVYKRQTGRCGCGWLARIGASSGWEPRASRCASTTPPSARRRAIGSG